MDFMNVEGISHKAWISLPQSSSPPGHHSLSSPLKHYKVTLNISDPYKQYIFEETI